MKFYWEFKQNTLFGSPNGFDMNSLDENWNLFCSKLEQVKPTSNGIIARCPAHNDVKPSLTASCNSEKILAMCQTGCSFKSIVTAVGMNQSQFFAPSNCSKTTKMKEVCRYRYENKDGKYTFDVVRFEPKDFRPQRPDGKWTLEGVVRVPYRLPQILAGIKDGKDILILEGEKDCDNAAKIGLTATTFLGGTGKWCDDYLQWFRGAVVYCIPDNDIPGRNGMNKIASKLTKVAKKVHWLELPEVPIKGDLSDWISIAGNDIQALRKLKQNALEWETGNSNKHEVVAKNGVFKTAETKQEEWQNPIPLVREEEESQPYPIGDLGPIIGEAAKEFQNYGKQPLSMVGSSALATASLCCQGLADVSRDSQNTSPISLSFLSIAESGERKTSTDKAFSKSLRDWQRYKAEEIKDEVRISVAQHAAWEAERTGLLTAIREAKRSSRPINGKSLDDLKNDLESHELGKPEMLQPPRLFFEDTNAEALAYFAAKGYPSFSLWSDEAGLTIGSHGMRDDRMMGFLALLNRMWDGGEFEPSRKIAKTAPIIGRRCTVNLMLQKSILEHWQEAGKGLTRGIGAFSRFLILKPISTMGVREYKEPPKSLPKNVQFHNRVREIMGTLPLPLNNQRQLEPPTLHFSQEAKQEWILHFNTIESALNPGGMFVDIPDFASKFGEQAARIAAVLHIFENGPTGIIESGTMNRAIKIAVWHLWEANLIFTTSSLPQEFKDAKILLNWILTRCQKSQESQESQLSHKSILHEGPNRLRDKKRRDAALNVLEDHQTVRLETVNQVKLIKVNPALTN
jgi:hypothetical protein